MLKIENLEVKANEKIILHDFNLEINDGEIHVLMGPNGTGKSTICKAILKHPDYTISQGTISFDNQIINDLDTTSISRLGIFLLSQNPTEIEGVTNAELIRLALANLEEQVDIFKLNDDLKKICETLKVDKSFVHRDINFNMSGGEKKKNELIQLLMLKPKLIILDEIDSGLDVDALKIVGDTINKYYKEEKPSILIITHHINFLNNFENYYVHVLRDGQIITSGDKSLAKEIELQGFEANTINGMKKHE